MGGVTLCRCELVTDEDIKAAIDRWNVHSMNEVKLITRAGKGACQGRCCFSLVRALVAHVLGVDPGTLLPPRVRLPVRPVPVVLFGRPGTTTGDTISMIAPLQDSSRERRT